MWLVDQLLAKTTDTKSSNDMSVPASTGNDDENVPPAATMVSVMELDGFVSEMLITHGWLSIVGKQLHVEPENSEKKEETFEVDISKMRGLRQAANDVAFEFLIYKKAGDYQGFGIIFDTPEERYMTQMCLLMLMVDAAPCLLYQTCCLEYDCDQRAFVPLAENAAVLLLDRPQTSEVFLMVIHAKEGQPRVNPLAIGDIPDANVSGYLRGLVETDVVFLQQLTQDLQIWPIAQKGQITFWGPSRTGGMQTYRLEIRFDPRNNNGVTYEKQVAQFLISLSHCLECSGEMAGKKTRLDTKNTCMMDTERPRVNSETFDHGNADDDVEMVAWEGQEEEEARPAVSTDPTTLSRRQQLLKRAQVTSDSSDNSDDEHDTSDHRFLEVGTGRTFACRSNRNSGKPVMKVYGSSSIDKDKRLAAVGTIKSDKFAYQHKTIDVSKGMLHDHENKMLLASHSDRTKVFLMDIEKETVIQSWESTYQGIGNLCPTFKGGSNSSDPTFLVNNSKALFMMDTRMDKNAQTTSIVYAKNPQLSCATTTESGGILVGSKLGELRLYDGGRNRDDCFKRAKTQLNTTSEPIIAVDTFKDGSWIAATYTSYVLVYPMRLASTGKTGFEASLGKAKPKPHILRLSMEDIKKWQIKNIQFRPARFNDDETCLVTSTGSLAIIWDMNSIRAGNPEYQVKNTESFIKDVQVTTVDSMLGSSVVVAYPHSVEVMGMRRQKRKSGGMND